MFHIGRLAVEVGAPDVDGILLGPDGWGDGRYEAVRDVVDAAEECNDASDGVGRVGHCHPEFLSISGASGSPFGSFLHVRKAMMYPMDTRASS